LISLKGYLYLLLVGFERDWKRVRVSERGGGVARYVLKSVSDLNLQRGREKESALAFAYFLSDFKC
jgi:hypothetical protein